MDKKNLLKKGFAAGIAVLFFGAVIASGANEISISSNLTEKINKNSFFKTSSFDFELNNDEFCIPKTEYIDQQQTYHGSSGYNVNYGQFVAQSFKPSVERLSKVDLKIFRYNGVPDYDFEFSIRLNPTGADMVKVTRSGSQIKDGWNEFDFYDLQVDKDKTYYLVCEGDDGHGDDPIYCWFNAGSNLYDRGMVHIFNYGSWHDVPTDDCCFKTYYTNSAPNSPSISGPTSGKIGKTYDFKFMSFDQDDDDIYYYIDWGDDYIEDWIGPFDSSEEITRSHKWQEEGTFVIKAKAKDTFNMESNWGHFEIDIPRAKSTGNFLFMKIFEKLPILEEIISKIIIPL